MKQTLENAQTTSTFSSVDPFQPIFPQNYLLAGKLLCLSLIHCSFWRVWASVQARGRGLNRFFFPFLSFFLLKISLYLISSCNLQLSSWKADPGFAHYEHNSQFYFFFLGCQEWSHVLGYFHIFKEIISKTLILISSLRNSTLGRECVLSVDWTEYIFTATVSPWRNGIKETLFGLLYRKGNGGFVTPTHN